MKKTTVYTLMLDGNDLEVLELALSLAPYSKERRRLACILKDYKSCTDNGKKYNWETLNGKNSSFGK